MPKDINRSLFYLIIMVCLFVCFSFENAFSLKADEVLLVVNQNSSSGMKLAKYYCKKRKIAEKRIFLVAMQEEESCSREEYLEQIKKPLKSFLLADDNAGEIKCLLLMYGLPLKVRQVKPEQPIKQKKSIGNDTRSSLDSEIALVKIDNYPLGGWMQNPHYKKYSGSNSLIKKENTLLVCRLDAPSPGMVKRIINDSIAIERKELVGRAYFDARWPINDNGKRSAYRQYDRSIHDTAKIIENSKKMSVTLNDVDTLFQKGECENAALYCGWYSLSQYIDAFQWAKGAIAYHIASAECTTLKRKKSQVWCKRMIEEGVAATLGPVGEPYVQAFPLPAIFFGTLIDGYDTLVEAYFASLPHVSWKMVLIGDPLYRPFDLF